MTNGLLGKKIGMSQIFAADGQRIPVTVLEVGPCTVLQKKTRETDGYEAVQLGYDVIKEKNTVKPRKGIFDKAGTTPRRYLVEFDFSDVEEVKIGDEIKADILTEGSMVKVSGISKGKGFQGTIKRHNFAMANKTHGQSDRLRAPGSIGQSAWPSRVFKGMRMAGRMGGDRVTLKNVRVVKVDVENNLVFLKGALPGAKNTLLEIRK